MIYLGDKKVGSIYLGDKKLSKIYLGDKLVWEGYPSGHIIGTIANSSTLDTSNFYNNKLMVSELSEDKYGESLDSIICTLLKDSKGNYKTEVGSLNYFFDADLSSKSDIISGIVLFNSNSNRIAIENIYSMKITLTCTKSTDSLNGFITDDSELKSINVNGVKLDFSNTSNSMKLTQSFSDCSNLQEIKAGKFPWEKFTELQNVFYHLSNLHKLDLSGANFDNIDLSSNYNNFRDFPTGVNIILKGCSSTTINKIHTVCVSHSSLTATWKLENDILTRTT